MIYVEGRRGMGDARSLLSSVGSSLKNAGKTVARDTVTGAGNAIGNRLRSVVANSGAASPPGTYQPPSRSNLPLILAGAAALGVIAFVVTRHG